MNSLLELYSRIKSSIAFYPALMVIATSALALLMVSYEDSEITKMIAEKVPFVLIDNADTARSILNTLIGGIISLTVFSFSMVMIILNQASSNYSPRLLPGLITNKKHQFVLGFYLSTIIVAIICSMNILPGDDPYSIPSLSILFSIILGISSMALFVFFIHSISESIQIGKILSRLFTETEIEIDRIIEIQKSHPDIQMDTPKEWKSLQCKEGGFLIALSEGTLLEIAEKHNCVIEVMIEMGQFSLPQTEVLKYRKADIGEEEEEQMLSTLKFGAENYSGSTINHGFKQVTEIAVKAMSPGINDPGTASSAIQYLIKLLAKRCQLKDQYYRLSDWDEKPKVIYNLLPFKQLIYKSINPIRTYSSHDTMIMAQLLNSLRYLSCKKGISQERKNIIEEEIKVLQQHSQKHIDLDYDLDFIMQENINSACWS